MEHNFYNWLAGFIDGEGCFSIIKVASQYNYFCKFAIEVRDDDSEIIEYIHKTLGIGTIYRQPQRKTSKPKIIWSVNSKADCLKLVEILDEHPLRAKKKIDYSIWREAVLCWESDYKTGVTVAYDWSKMLDFKERLTAAKLYPEQA